MINEDDIGECAEKIFKSLSGKSREQVILEIIMNSDFEKRLKICKYYNDIFKRDLYSDLKSKLSGHFKELSIHLFLPPLEYIAKNLKRAFKGFSTDENIVYETLTTYNQEELSEIEEAYKKEAGKDLATVIAKNFSGVMKKNLLNLLSTPRRVNPNPNYDECEKFATNLMEIGITNWVGEENVFKEIFITRSPEELVLISRIYFLKTGNYLLDIVEKKLSNKHRGLLKELLYNTIAPYELFAEKIYNSIKGLGTNNSMLNRILTLRTQVDMELIRDVYQSKYNSNLREDIAGDTSGVYQQLCLYLAEATN